MGSQRGGQVDLMGSIERGMNRLKYSLAISIWR